MLFFSMRGEKSEIVQMHGQFILKKISTTFNYTWYTTYMGHFGTGDSTGLDLTKSPVLPQGEIIAK